MFTKIKQEYKKKGWFKKYPTNHIIYPALEGKKMPLEETDNDYIRGIKSMYNTFIANFFKILLYIQENFCAKDNKWIVKNYLACEQEYTDKEFLIRYSNVLIMCGLRSLNAGVKQCEMKLLENTTIFRLKYEDNIVIQYYSAVVDRGDSRKEFIQENLLELEVGLRKKEIEEFKKNIGEKGIRLASSKMQQVVDGLGKVADLPNVERTYNICLLQLISNNARVDNISSIEGLLLNEYTGIFKNDILHEEYNYYKEMSQRIDGVLVFKYNFEFFLYGDMRYLLLKEHNFIAVNKLSDKVIDKEVLRKLYPFVLKESVDRAIGAYNVKSEESLIWGDIFFRLMLENYKAAISSVFSNREATILKYSIKANLMECPQLLSVFELSLDMATEEIYKQYESMFRIIYEKYPRDHPFRRNNFLYDAMSFSLAYCMYIVPNYLTNSDMIADFLQNKLICEKDGLFDRKVFNESYSEFEIFFYLFVGIFLNSERYKTFLKLDYEPSGNRNKRFEYAFVFKDYRINVEVKALECAPEHSDNIDLMGMKNGARFYKNYFHAYDENDVIPLEVLENATKLKSNYRQVSKNIKKIKEKCVEEEGVVNLGFLMINYGTSREEYISYLMNRDQGYLRKNALDKLDAVIFFSMCVNTDLLMTRILEQEHILVFPNLQKDNYALFSDLRLNNYVFDQGESRYMVYFDDVYGEYTGLHSQEGLVTIQRRDAAEAEWELAQSAISQADKFLSTLVELSK